MCIFPWRRLGRFEFGRRVGELFGRSVVYRRIDNDKHSSRFYGRREL
jgi:hypothetical protein